jgi:glycerol-3-phosphate acyltransferase PlsY
LRAVAVIVSAYLLGSLPFGYLIVHATRGDDVRETGSGGTGATNVSRRAGKGAGVLTLLLDALKGAAAVVTAQVILEGQDSWVDQLGGHIGPPVQHADWWLAAAAIAVIVGHIFPVWLRFRGGKGVATGIGVFIMLTPLAVFGAAVIFTLVVWLTRYISLGSLLAASFIALFVVIQHFIRPLEYPAPLVVATIGGAGLIVFAHRENIGRLLRGNESRFK